MKKLFLTALLATAMLSVLLTGSIGVAAIDLGDADASVVVDDIHITYSEGAPYIGTYVTVSGIIYADANAWAAGFFPHAEAETSYSYSISGPGVCEGCSCDNYDAGRKWLGVTTADLSDVYNWSETFCINGFGEYEIISSGSASAEYSAWFFRTFSGQDSACGSKTLKFHSDYDTRNMIQVVMAFGTNTWRDTGKKGELMSEVIAYGYYGNVGYKMVIPIGTIVTGGKFVFLASVTGGVPQFNGDLTFSKPGTLYKTTGKLIQNNDASWTNTGSWEQVCTFING